MYDERKQNRRVRLDKQGREDMLTGAIVGAILALMVFAVVRDYALNF